MGAFNVCIRYIMTKGWYTQEHQLLLDNTAFFSLLFQNGEGNFLASFEESFRHF